MPYNGRKRYYKRSKRVKKSTAMSKKGAKAQSKQIIKLQNQIDKINVVVKDVSMYRQYQYPLSGTIGAGVAPSYGVFNLINPSIWTEIFQSPSGQETMSPNKFRGRSIGMEGMIQLADPDAALAPVTGTIFLASLRKEVANQFAERTGDGANLTERVDYCKTDMGALQGSGMVMLNKGTFKIHEVRRFMIGGKTNFETDFDAHDTAPTTNLKDNNYRFYMKHRYQNLLKSDGPDSRTVTTSGGFRTLTKDTLEPTDQLFMFIFCNAYGDQAVNIHLNTVITGKTSN